MTLVTMSSSAQIYGGRSGDDTVVLSDFPGAATPTLLVPGREVPSGNRGAGRKRALAPEASIQAITPIVSEIAREVGLPDHLLHAVIEVESGYDPRAVSSKGAQGLMQLMPATARRFGVVDSFDPRDNVRGGALYLKWLLEFFGGDLSLAIAGYNAGEQAVVRAGYRVPPHAETQRYVPRVMSRLQSG